MYPTSLPYQPLAMHACMYPTNLPYQPLVSQHMFLFLYHQHMADRDFQASKNMFPWPLPRRES